MINSRRSFCCNDGDGDSISASKQHARDLFLGPFCRLCFGLFKKTKWKWPKNQVKTPKKAYVFLRTKHTTVCPAFPTKTSTLSDRQTDHSPISLQSSGDTSSVFWWQVLQPCFSFYHFSIIIIVCNSK